MNRKGLIIGISILILLIISIAAIIISVYTAEIVCPPSGTPGLRRHPETLESWFPCSSMTNYNVDLKNGIPKETLPGYGDWVDQYKKFLDTYNNQNGAKNCSIENPASEHEVCKFDLSQLGPCGKDNFGYDSGDPCIILELNNISNLTLAPIDINNLPDNHGMSNQLIEHIKIQSDKNQIWVECQGEWGYDKEALKGLFFS